MDSLAWEQYSDSIIREKLHEALESLPESERTVLTLYYLGGLSCEEIARFMGTSRGAIKDRLYRARSHSKQEMIEMIEKTWAVFQLPPAFTQQIVSQIRHLKPTVPSSSKPWLPWVASTALAILALFIGWGVLQTTVFQMPYSFNSLESELRVKLMENPILKTSTPKLAATNQVGEPNSQKLSDGNQSNAPAVALAVDAQRRKNQELRGAFQVGSPIRNRANLLPICRFELLGCSLGWGITTLELMRTESIC